MFYHSFPRPKPGQDSIQKGLRILGNFLKNGILLVPEDLRYDRGSGAKRDTLVEYHVMQNRFCVTQIDISELKDHEKYFGSFHIEFKNEDMYDLGAMPVFYLPRSETSTSEWSLKKLPASCIYELFELQNVCNDIRSIAQNIRNIGGDETITYNIDNRAEGKGKKYTLNVSQLHDVLDMLTLTV
jgi:hypothetical protein